MTAGHKNPPFQSNLRRPGHKDPLILSNPNVNKTVEVFANKANDQSNHINAAMENFSSWTRLKRVMAWLLRYKQNLNKQSQRRKAKEVISYQSDVSKITPLSVTEVNEAEREIVKFVQKQTFKEELLALSRINRVCKETEKTATKNPTKKSSSICKLDPVLENGLIRVGGRLHQAPIESDA